MRFTAGFVACLILCQIMVGCSQDPSAVNSSNTDQDAATASIQGGDALLDWQAASITLPIDHYGMSLDEELLVDAAGSLEFARCIQQTDKYDAGAVAEAVRYIGSVPMYHHWRFGWWNANYVAQYGPYGIEDLPLQYMLGGASEEDIRTCFDDFRSKGFLGLTSGGIDEIGLPLTLGDGQSMELTAVDPAFLALRDEWRQCINQAGYLTYGQESDWSAVVIDYDWSQELISLAALEEAKCSDSLGYTQQVANITASYQNEFINSHEAELVEIKRIADERVAKSVAVLKEAGVL